QRDLAWDSQGGYCCGPFRRYDAGISNNDDYTTRS
ncbi:unnamed protein product, partial [Allacma fusca]